MVVRKTLVLCLSSVFTVGYLTAHEVSTQERSVMSDMVTCPVTKASCTVDTAEQLRKINISEFLHNLATAVHYVGRATTATTQQEKGEAAFGIVEALLNLVADASKKSKQSPVVQSEDIDSAAFIEARTQDVVMRVLEILDNPEHRAVEDCGPVLEELRSLKTHEECCNAITQKLRSYVDKAVLMSAALDVLKKAVEKRVLLVVEALNNGHNDVLARSLDGEEVDQEIDDQPVSTEVTTWWDQIVNFTTQNSIVTAIGNGFSDVYNYLLSFFTKPTAGQ